jgi:hypothetical protein
VEYHVEAILSPNSFDFILSHIGSYERASELWLCLLNRAILRAFDSMEKRAFDSFEGGTLT